MQAQDLLESAARFEERDEIGAALRGYRRVATEFAGSPAAKEAGWRIDGLKSSAAAKRR